VTRRLLTLLPAAWLALVTGALHAATGWQVDRERSRLVFVPVVDGGELTGRFERFDATVEYDPADLSQSRLVVDVDLGSAASGDAERDDALKGPDFFAIAQWPHALFEAVRFRAVGPGRFEAQGKLRLRDVTREVPVRFEFSSTDGATARLKGSARVRRLDFGVGQGDLRDTKWIADEVRVEFDLNLRRRP